MNPEEIQDTNEMTPDEAAASLSFATRLSEGMMPQESAEAPQEPQDAPGEELLALEDEEEPEESIV